MFTYIYIITLFIQRRACFLNVVRYPLFSTRRTWRPANSPKYSSDFLFSVTDTRMLSRPEGYSYVITLYAVTFALAYVNAFNTISPLIFEYSYFRAPWKLQWFSSFVLFLYPSFGKQIYSWFSLFFSVMRTKINFPIHYTLWKHRSLLTFLRIVLTLSSTSLKMDGLSFPNLLSTEEIKVWHGITIQSYSSLPFYSYIQ
jgi:hypothetical protein